jgi:hypothetical protein
MAPAYFGQAHNIKAARDFDGTDLLGRDGLGGGFGVCHANGGRYERAGRDRCVSGRSAVVAIAESPWKLSSKGGRSQRSLLWLCLLIGFARSRARAWKKQPAGIGARDRKYNRRPGPS